MYRVGDLPRHRESRIRSTCRLDPAVSVLQAAAHFEWTLSRTILGLGTSPNKLIRERLKYTSGLKKYCKLWRDEVGAPGLEVVVTTWNALEDAMDLRHKLIHGRAGTGRVYAEPRVDTLLRCAADVHAFALRQGVELNKRLPVRRIRR